MDKFLRGPRYVRLHQTPINHDPAKWRQRRYRAHRIRSGGNSAISILRLLLEGSAEDFEANEARVKEKEREELHLEVLGIGLAVPGYWNEAAAARSELGPAVDVEREKYRARDWRVRRMQAIQGRVTEPSDRITESRMTLNLPRYDLEMIPAEISAREVGSHGHP